MKKLLVGLSFIFVVYYLVALSSALAQTTIQKTTHAQVSTGVSEPDATKSAEKIDYVLPYPGILPDNPLYFLKAARDGIISFLISDPVKKAEFNLLTSDKRIYASLMLAEKDKDDLVISTLSKSNNYFHQAIGNASEAKRMGKNVDTVLHNMGKSIKKHREVLEMVEGKVGRQFSNQLQNETKRMVEFENSVHQLNPE